METEKDEYNLYELKDNLHKLKDGETETIHLGKALLCIINSIEELRFNYMVTVKALKLSPSDMHKLAEDMVKELVAMEKKNE